MELTGLRRKNADIRPIIESVLLKPAIYAIMVQRRRQDRCIYACSYLDDDRQIVVGLGNHRLYFICI